MRLVCQVLLKYLRISKQYYANREKNLHIHAAACKGTQVNIFEGCALHHWKGQKESICKEDELFKLSDFTASRKLALHVLLKERNIFNTLSDWQTDWLTCPNNFCVFLRKPHGLPARAGSLYSSPDTDNWILLTWQIHCKNYITLKKAPWLYAWGPIKNLLFKPDEHHSSTLLSKERATWFLKSAWPIV